MKMFAPILAVVFILGLGSVLLIRPISTDTQVASPSAPTYLPVATSTQRMATTAPKTVTEKKPKRLENKPNFSPSQGAVATTSQAVKAPLPYVTPAESIEAVEVATRNALVNILCMPDSGTLRPISGSGVLIDSDGIILTNAHVGQYVLLSHSPRINLSCTIRSGSPAKARWKAEVLFIPKIWVEEHFREINQEQVIGTGEHDYALLKIISNMDGSPVPGGLPYLEPEIRPNVAFEGDKVLVAGYPAEFVGGIVAQQGLYAALSPSTIDKLLTFKTGTVDVFSIGGVLEAQGGSSGGPVVNFWRKLVGLIVTTSEGATTAERDLHTLNLNYIARDFELQAGESFEGFLNGDHVQQLDVFTRNVGTQLLQAYVSHLSR